MQVQTTRFGLIEVDNERVIQFPKGVLGFPEVHDYVLLQTNEEGNFFWMQAAREPDLAFVVCDPALFVPGYEVPLKLDEFSAIGLDRREDAQIFVIVNKVDRTLTGNLQGPLVVNARNRQGMQLVLSEKKFNTRHPLIDLEARQPAVARTA